MRKVKSIRDWLLDSEDHQILRLCILAPVAGLLYVGGWALFLAFAYFGIKAMFWWIQKSNESLESWFWWVVAPVILFGLLSFLWEVLSFTSLPWLDRVIAERRRKRQG
ncbi:MAG: hypothetical protein IPK93_02690 [Solirubrobacterales bacterium]|nr:hypothetical protein [Solirubrobacterales bacterium]